MHIPTQELIQSLDPTGHLSVEDLLHLVHAKVQDYMRTINDGFQDKLKIFHTLTAHSKPWSPAVHHKCSCESSFKDAICTYAILLALLCDSTLKIPTQYLCTGIPARRKRGRQAMQLWDPDDTAEQNEQALLGSQGEICRLHSVDIMLTRPCIQLAPCDCEPVMITRHPSRRQAFLMFTRMNAKILLSTGEQYF